MLRFYGLFAPGLCLILALGCPPALAWQKSDVLRPANVAGVAVGGLTPREARQRVARRLASKLNFPLVLTDGNKRISRRRRDWGARIDAQAMIAHAKAGQKRVAAQFVIDRHLLRAALRHVTPRFAASAQDAKLVERSGGVKTLPGHSARSLNVEKSAARIAALVESRGATRIAPVVLDKKPARVTASAFRGITGRLGRFSTAFHSGSSKRTHNIRVAVAKINGRIVAPGAAFSLNETLGERTHSHGYLTAPVYLNKKLVSGIGGGVSQVAGTLFNAALLSGLPVLEYGTHARPVAYMPIGRDATLAWQHIDLKFKNNTSAPLYIAYEVTGNRVVATLYGAAVAGRRVSLSVRTKKLGPRRITAALYRVIRKNGQIVKKEKIGRSNYNWKPEEAE